MNVHTAAKPMPLQKRDLERIARIVCDLSGIEISPDKTSLVQARLARAIRRTGVRSFAEYCDIVENPRATDERAELLSALTTNVTRFFRERHHFEHMVQHSLPALEKKADRGHPIRIWSAAASTGEEPYSIAMTIAKHWPKARLRNVEILATDIDPNVIERAKSGVYRLSPQDLETLSPYRSFLSASDGTGTVTVLDDIRNMVSFDTLNLHARWPMRSAFDIVFCRNVVIYFNERRQEKIWDNMAAALTNGGTIYIGHSERIETCQQRGLELTGVTTYRKLD